MSDKKGLPSDKVELLHLCATQATKLAEYERLIAEGNLVEMDTLIDYYEEKNIEDIEWIELQRFAAEWKKGAIVHG